MSNSKEVSYKLAYDSLRIMYNKTVIVFTILMMMMVWYLNEAKTALELNNKRYEEMRKAYEVQAIYFNNMKARFEAVNEAKNNE